MDYVKPILGLLFEIFIIWVVIDSILALSKKIHNNNIRVIVKIIAILLFLALELYLNSDSLDQAIAQGAYGVSTLFSDNETAVTYIPEWNTAWFADVKAAILSGEYTFVKAGTSMYLLGKVGAVSTSNYDYAISYNVQ